MPPLQFGDITVHLVNDGFLDMDPATFFPGVPADALAEYPGAMANGRLHIPMITFLVQVDGRTILVDTGLGPHLGGFQGVCGALLEGL
ncbi:MAG: MBL fold metallo-hydrolase, partial [Dehalococcoidia bacterium]